MDELLKCYAFFLIALTAVLEPALSSNGTCSNWTPEFRVWMGGTLTLACLGDYPEGQQPSWSNAAAVCNASGGYLMPMKDDDTVGQLLALNATYQSTQTKTAMPIDMVADQRGGFFSLSTNQSYSDSKGIFGFLNVRMSTFYGTNLRGFLDINPVTKAVKLFVQDEGSTFGVADHFLCIKVFQKHCNSEEILAINYLNRYQTVSGLMSQFTVLTPLTLNLMTTIWGNGTTDLPSGVSHRLINLRDVNEGIVISPGDTLLFNCSETFWIERRSRVTTKKQMVTTCNDGGMFDWPVKKNFCRHDDPCIYKLCYNGGTCVSQSYSFICACPKPFFGERCQNRLCDRSDIARHWKPNSDGSVSLTEDLRETLHWCSHGECSDSGQCNCWYSAGPRCLFPADDCWDEPCRNGGLCIDLVNAYECICPSDWFGLTCENSGNPCLSNPCRSGGLCTYDRNNFTCQCSRENFGPTCSEIVSSGKAEAFGVSLGITIFTVMTTSALCMVCTKLRKKDSKYASSVKLEADLKTFLRVVRKKEWSNQQAIIMLKSAFQHDEASDQKAAQHN